MSTDIHIVLQDGELSARLEDSPSPTAIADVLLLEGKANRWGDEIYFTIPVQ